MACYALISLHFNAFFSIPENEVATMNNVKKGICITLAVMALAGCMHRSNAIKSDGRPHAPSGQSSPGGTLGSGPVGQPQS
jgi:hypothetical protein